MPLSSGTRLGPYEILGLIGKGGMGEVYCGTDTRLRRPVAIKVSSREFNDRFEREARAISALNHPNICTLYDVGSNYLVMEFVEGELLSEIIARGPLPLDKALAYAVQIVDALAAAHAKGVIHRDLKPGNIIVTNNGVKVLDFGLAKLGRGKPSSDSAVDVETVTEPITRSGAILGTLYYMSPEQVEGKDTDERSDIFSFGVVLYEMITGQRPFSGDTQAAVLASLLKDQPPPMSQRQSATPRALERVVRRCLEKKPADRWSSALDLKRTMELIDLDAPPVTTSSASVPIPVQKQTNGWRWLWPIIGAAMLVAIAAVAVWVLWLKPASPARATRFQVTLPEDVDFSEYVSVSPDGHKLVFNATGAQSGLWIHDLDTLEWRRLEGTEGARAPFWSPDSRFLGFGLGNDLKKIEVAGGPPQTLCTIQQPVGTGTWSQGGTILFGPYRVNGPIRRVSSAGGVPAAVTELAGDVRFHYLPNFLPDGRHFLYLREGTADVDGIYAGSLDAKPAEQSNERILATRYGVTYLDGNLFFMRDGTLMTQPFDTGKLQLTGEPVPVVEHVGTVGATGIFSVSRSGALAYRSGASNGGATQATWFDRQGKPTGTFGQPGPDGGLKLSPDATRAAGRDQPQDANGDIWLLDFSRGVRTRFTFHQSTGSSPVWSSDGSRIIFAAGNLLDTIYEKSATGAGEERALLKTASETMLPTSWSRDGRFLLYAGAEAKTGDDLWALPLESNSKPAHLLSTPFNELYGSFSPDGRWIAYISNESGRNEIYVRPFVGSGSSAPTLGEGKWQLSRDGAFGAIPKWTKDGKEIIFMGVGRAMMAVDVNGRGAAFQMGTPKQLFTALPNSGWDVTGDGQRFLMTVEPGQGQNTQTPITVVLNWQADLKK